MPDIVDFALVAFCGAAFAVIGANFIIRLIGFTTVGVAQGSFAAFIHRMIHRVSRIFAALQRAGARMIHRVSRIFAALQRAGAVGLTSGTQLRLAAFGAIVALIWYCGRATVTMEEE